jgi:hypothetical protein
MIGQPQRIPFVGFEQPRLPFLDMHKVHGDIELLEILDQTLVVVASDLQQHIDLGQGHLFAHALQQGAKPFAGLLKAQRWTAFKSLVAREQGGRDETGNMLGLTDIDANIERFV